MLELLINPKKAERKPWQMLFIGLVYGFLSLILASLIFSKDAVLSQYSGVFVITFCVIFSMPFIYYTLKLEERKDREYAGEFGLLREHSRALWAFLWLFLGFVIAFSIWYTAFPGGENFFRAQVETFCQINNPDSISDYVRQYGLEKPEAITGNTAVGTRFLSIFSNNIYVLIFTLVLSLAFGAGAIFILAWNASVIAAAIGIFMKSDITHLPLAMARYLIHGLPEIAAYFIAAISGGILSIAIIRHDTRSPKFWSIMLDAIALMLIGIAVLFVSALIEVFITPKLF